MKFVPYFVVENLLVTSQRIGKRFESSAYEKWPAIFFDDADIIPFETTGKTGTRIEITTPLVDEILGIEMTEIESFDPDINGIRPPVPQPCSIGYCSQAGWESLDSNGGTGDHESFE